MQSTTSHSRKHRNACRWPRVSVHSGPNPGDERMWLYRSLAGIDQRTILDTTTGGVGGITIGTHSRYFAIPQDDAEETI